MWGKRPGFDFLGERINLGESRRAVVGHRRLLLMMRLDVASPCPGAEHLKRSGMEKFDVTDSSQAWKLILILRRNKNSYQAKIKM
jgi:hypothetical protein